MNLNLSFSLTYTARTLSLAFDGKIIGAARINRCRRKESSKTAAHVAEATEDKHEASADQLQ